MNAWHLAKSLESLRTRINTLAPRRSTKSDGTVGDLAHSARKSDHNPDENGTVMAMDITHDPANGCDGKVLAESLRQSRDPRIKYVIWDQRIFSSTVQPWKWRPYNGTNPHSKHVHVSVAGPAADKPGTWNVRVS